MKKIVITFGILLAALPAFSGVFSFTGTFGQDDEIQTIVFHQASALPVFIQTLSYAGGVNLAGSTISSGGFDPILTLFAGLGGSATVFAVNNDGGCANVGTDGVTGACWDSYLELAGLPVGDYTLILSQADNFANGPTLGDGYGRSGQGNFTGPAFLGGPGSFIDANPAQRQNHWAVDLVGDGLGSASIPSAAIPEPATMGLLTAASALLAIRARRS